MVKTLTAHTSEIDDVELAVSEILEQLDLAGNCRENSVGILTCYPDFIESGVAKSICDALPFDVVGCSTIGAAVPGGLGMMELALAVLTSDDVVFSVAVTTSMRKEQEAPIAAAYRRAAEALPEAPSLVLAYGALVVHVGGDSVIDMLDRVSGGLPVFGTLAVDHTLDYSKAWNIHNGELSTETLTLVLVSGAIWPQFHMNSISERKILKQRAVITASRGNILQEVNGIPILTYMESIGLAVNSQIPGAIALPLIVDVGDGSKPVARAIYSVTPENHILCGGAMPVGATLLVGVIDYDDVLETAADTLENALETGRRDGMLLYSCMTRSLALGLDTMAEMNLVQRRLQGEVPYHFAYSGGEICPVTAEDGSIVNRFHNDTIIACVL